MNAANQSLGVVDFSVRRDDWRTGRFSRAALPEALAAGRVVLSGAPLRRSMR